MDSRHWARRPMVLLVGSALALIAAGSPAPGQEPNAAPGQQPAPTASAAPKSGQSASGAPAAPAKPAVTPEESKAYNALRSELDPSRQIELVDQFAQSFPNSSLLSDVYFFGAYAYQQQGKIDKVIAYGSKSLQADPNNWKSLLTMATMLPEPQDMAQGSDAEKEKKLNDAEADANKAIQLVSSLGQGNLTPEQLAQLKTTVNVQAHEALGMIHMQRATMGLAGPDQGELAKAEQEYKAANTASPQPNPADFFRLGEIYQMENKIDDAIGAFTQASKLGQGTAIQGLADQQVAALKKQKDQAQAPAKP
jgi:tetratricopeptide (TPR) repeat protein